MFRYLNQTSLHRFYAKLLFFDSNIGYESACKICTTSFKLSSKKNQIELDLLDKADKTKQRPKTLDFKQKVYLKNVNGEILGLKTLSDANRLAKKSHCKLELDDSIKKIVTYKMVDTKKISDVNDGNASSSDSESSNKSKHRITKHMMFSSNVSKNDLDTKINQCKRIVSKGHVALVKVTSAVSDLNNLVNFFISKLLKKSF